MKEKEKRTSNIPHINEFDDPSETEEEPSNHSENFPVKLIDLKEQLQQNIEPQKSRTARITIP